MLLARILALSIILIATCRPVSVSVASFTFPNEPWPSVLPKIYLPTLRAVGLPDDDEEEEDEPVFGVLELIARVSGLGVVIDVVPGVVDGGTVRAGDCRGETFDEAGIGMVILVVVVAFTGAGSAMATIEEWIGVTGV